MNQNKTNTCLENRITYLSQMETGWLDGTGRPVDQQAVNWVRSFIKQLDHTKEKIALFPLPDGGISIESQFEDKRWSAEVSKNTEADIATLSGDQFEYYSSQSIKQAVSNYQCFFKTK
jgi:hypothetical protein